MKTTPFTIGNRVRWSGYALKSRRDYWLGCGRASEKSAARDELDRATAVRGTVTACEPGKYAAWTVDVRTDDGAQHNSLPGMWEVCT